MEIKILIIRFSDTKDVLLRTPVIRRVRMAYPDAQIDFLTDKSAELLLKYNPHLDFLFTLEPSKSYKNLWRTRKKIRLSSYTHIFDLQNNSYSKFFCLFRAAESLLEKEEKGQAGNEKANRPLSLLTDIWTEKQASREQRPEIFWKDTVAKPVSSFLKSRNIHSGYILVDDARHSFQDKYAELIREIGRNHQNKMVLLGEERKAGFSKTEKEKMVFTNGRFNLLERAILINRSRVVLTANILYSTIAQALGIPVVSLSHTESVNIPRIMRDLKAAH